MHCVEYRVTKRGGIVRTSRGMMGQTTTNGATQDWSKMTGSELVEAYSCLDSMGTKHQLTYVGYMRGVKDYRSSQQ